MYQFCSVLLLVLFLLKSKWKEIGLQLTVNRSIICVNFLKVKLEICIGKESDCNARDPTGEGIGYPLQYSWASLVAQLVKNPPAMQPAWVRSLDWEDPWRRERLPIPVFWPGEFHNCIVHGVTKSQTRLSDFWFTLKSFKMDRIFDLLISLLGIYSKKSSEMYTNLYKQVHLKEWPW